MRALIAVLLVLPGWVSAQGAPSSPPAISAAPAPAKVVVYTGALGHGGRISRAIEDAIAASTAPRGGPQAAEFVPEWNKTGRRESLIIERFRATAGPAIAIVTALGYADSTSDPYLQAAIRLPEFLSCSIKEPGTRLGFHAEFTSGVRTVDPTIEDMVDLGPVVVASSKPLDGETVLTSRPFLVFNNDQLAIHLAREAFEMEPRNFNIGDVRLLVSEKFLATYFSFVILDEFDIARATAALDWKYYFLRNRAVAIILFNEELRALISHDPQVAGRIESLTSELVKRMSAAGEAAYNQKRDTTPYPIPASFDLRTRKWESQWMATRIFACGASCPANVRNLAVRLEALARKYCR